MGRRHSLWEDLLPSSNHTAFPTWQAVALELPICLSHSLNISKTKFIFPTFRFNRFLKLYKNLKHFAEFLLLVDLGYLVYVVQKDLRKILGAPIQVNHKSFTSISPLTLSCFPHAASATQQR